MGHILITGVVAGLRTEEDKNLIKYLLATLHNYVCAFVSNISIRLVCKTEIVLR